MALGSAIALPFRRPVGDVARILDGTFASSSIAFTRASSKTYFDADGLLQTAPTNVWPVEYDPDTGLLLGRSVWEARTNLLTYSEQFDNAAWSKVNSTVSANATTAPDGTTTADKLVEDSSSASQHRLDFTSTIGAEAATFSIYAKAAERTQFYLRIGLDPVSLVFDLSTGAITTSPSAGTTAAIEDVGDGWYRCSITHTATTNDVVRINLLNAGNNTYDGDGASGIYIWGAQPEAGASASPYIKTEGSTATRAADTATITDLSRIGFNASEGTIVAEFVMPVVSAAGSDRVLSFNDGSVDNSIDLFVNSAGLVKMYCRAAASTVVDAGTDVIATGAVVKAVYAFAANNFAISVNGSTPTTDTTGAMPTGMNQLHIGRRQSGSYLKAPIKSLTYIPRRVSNAELQALSA